MYKKTHIYIYIYISIGAQRRTATVPKKYPVSAYGVSFKSLFHLSVGACLPELCLKNLISRLNKYLKSRTERPPIFVVEFLESKLVPRLCQNIHKNSVASLWFLVSFW